MNALKTASRRLIDKLQNTASKPGDVYVSIIPFNKNVNVGGPGNYHANWIDWEDWDADNGHEAVEKACEKASKKSGKLANKCKNSTNWVHDNHNTWNGCVTDRDMDYDVLNTTPDPAIASTLFPAEQYMACPVELMPLTYNWTQLRKTIDDMTPVGNTNQTIGLAWGWQSLSNAPPLRAPPKDKDHKYQDVVILLTDGLNTENRWSNNQVSIDARTQKVCDNIKGAGITIYTVLVMAGNSSILQNCASDSAKYFKLDSADQMIGAFDSIGTTLSQLRISK